MHDTESGCVRCTEITNNAPPRAHAALPPTTTAACAASTAPTMQLPTHQEYAQ